MERSASPSPQRSSGPTSKQQTELGLLFDRPGEPVFLPKGDENAIFDVPSEYIAEEYRPAREGIINRNKGELGQTFTVKQIRVPDLGAITSLRRQDNFSLFIPRHKELASRLIDILMGMRTYEDFISAAVFARDKVNPYLFIYALSVAILHRPDTKNVQLPPLFENFPDKYMEGGVIKRAREVSNILDPGSRTPLEIPRDYSASDADPEHRVAYFREDLGINLHHWHWHLVYPFSGNRTIVQKDRRGELFYYMHNQIVARYNMERLCNNLARVIRLSNLREPIPEGYFSKLDTMVSSRSWPPRHENASLNDVYREVDQLKLDISDLERWRDRILDAIAQAAIIDPDGRRIELDETTGIDILGDIIESSTLNRNPNYYGSFHNLGHVAISLCHDPLAKYLETFGVMGDPATAMRDPVFYRWHAYIDYIFQLHKNTLPGYTEQVLSYQGIRIAAVEVLTKGRNKNELVTSWEQNDIDLSRGMDFTPRGSVFARLTHLTHQPFSYRVLIENTTGQNRSGTVRIFIAPKYDERGIPFQFVDHRTLFVEMDRFPFTLTTRQNTVERRSTQSSVTIAFETTFRDLNRGRPQGNAEQQFNFCGCGWPQHMLVPKGTAAGYPCILFAMFSDADGDRVEQPAGSTSPRNCDDASSYCGIRDQKYPDRRNMGFPFDRPPRYSSPPDLILEPRPLTHFKINRNNVDTLRQFLTPNMAIADIRIFHQDRVVARQRTTN